jgi:hypothetical protein
MFLRVLIVNIARVAEMGDSAPESKAEEASIEDFPYGRLEGVGE